MKRLLLVLAAWTVAMPVSFAENLAAPGSVVPSENIVIRCPAPFEFGWTSPGQTYDCLGRTRSGYHVLLSREDKVGIGFLPFHDEWGRTTADSWLYNLQLPKNTVVTKVPMRLSPSWLILKQGVRYPATAVSDDEYNVTFAFKSFVTTVTVHRAQLQLPAPRKVEEAVEAASQELEVGSQRSEVGDESEEDELEPDLSAVSSAVVSAKADTPEPVPETAKVQPPAKEPETKVKAEPLPAVPPQPVPAQIGPFAIPPSAQPETKPVDATAQAEPAVAAKQIMAGVSAKASSTHEGLEGEGTPAALVDGDLGTRWSSEYAEPQNVIVDLGGPRKLATLRLYWETASAIAYRVSLSTDGEKWSPVHDFDLQKPGRPKPRVDEIDMRNITARQIRLDLLRRINPQWGFSLYEIEVVGAE